MTATPAIPDVVAVVAGFYRLHPEVAGRVGCGRGTWEVRIRQQAIYLARQLTGVSFGAIARHFGGADHTTIMHAVRRIDDLRKSDAALARRLDLIADRITRQAQAKLSQKEM